MSRIRLAITLVIICIVNAIILASFASYTVVEQKLDMGWLMFIGAMAYLLWVPLTYIGIRISLHLAARRAAKKVATAQEESAQATIA